MVARRIAILDLADLPEDFPPALRSVGDTIGAWLAPALPEAELVVVDVAGGAPMPGAEEFDGFVVSGSEKGVYDDAAWMAPLRDFIRTAAEARRPLVGICFGHQIVADTLGGRAEKAETGFVLGARIFETPAGPTEAYVAHQDQVVAVPPGARVTGRAAHCPIGMLAWDDRPILTTQFHPEYTAPFVEAIREAATGTLLDADQSAEVARNVADARVSPDLFAAEAAVLLRGG